MGHQPNNTMHTSSFINIHYANGLYFNSPLVVIYTRSCKCISKASRLSMQQPTHQPQSQEKKTCRVHLVCENRSRTRMVMKVNLNSMQESGIKILLRVRFDFHANQFFNSYSHSKDLPKHIKNGNGIDFPFPFSIPIFQQTD